MNIKSKTEIDQIRATGWGVSFDGPLPECEKCQSSRSMDDLHRQHIAWLGEELEISANAKQELRANLDQKIASNRTRWLIIFALGFALSIALADNAGMFK